MIQRDRPLSPHIQIYRRQLTSVMSILHRLTGVGLALGTLLLVYWVSSAAYGPDAYLKAQGFIGSWFGKLLLFGWSAALFYHLSNGVRHLLWDAGWGFDKRQVYASGHAVLVATAVLTVLAWIIGLNG
ncbi:MAG: succinate dehydrogenase, cytochrome b556 subunit [Alphaproteobacteria bacterium]